MSEPPYAHVCFALIADDQTHDLARAISLRLHRQCGTGLLAAQLPPHVSLKQPFAASEPELERVYAFADELAASLPPYRLTLVGPSHFSFPTPGGEIAIAQLDVVEQEELRGVHGQLNARLARLVAKPAAPYDGAGYHFHLTLSYGACPDCTRGCLERALAAPPLRHVMTATALSVFLSPDPEGRPGSFVTARSRRLAG